MDRAVSLAQVPDAQPAFRRSSQQSVLADQHQATHLAPEAQEACCSCFGLVSEAPPVQASVDGLERGSEPRCLAKLVSLVEEKAYVYLSFSA